MPKAEVELEKKLQVVEADKEIRMEPGEFGAILELIVKDKDGNVTERRVKKAESFLKQFLQLLWIQCNIIEEMFCFQYVKDTGNVDREVHENSLIFSCNAALGSVDYGIIIGSGNTAPTIDDYKIETIIPHATMNYSAVTFGLPADDGTISQFTITRDFSNVSGGAVTVNEIALYGRVYKYNTAYYVALIRDVITGGISVPNGQTLTVNYRIQATI